MVRVLHTSDWHVGKAIRGNSRADEHRAVLAEIAGIVGERAVDVVVVAGDLFETAAPTPEAEEIVYRALLDLAGTGATVVVVSGNHDNPSRLRAVAPLLELGRVHLVTEPRRPADGGVRRIEAASGEALSVALLPFVSQRGVVRAEALMADAAFQHAQAYADRMRLLIDVLAGGFDPGLPTMLVAHGFVAGSTAGGGERAGHLVEEYAIPAQAFPATAGYVALGHLHRAQKLPGATAIHYCGSPLQLDFGETTEPKQVNVVDLSVGKPAKVTPVELRAGSRLVTLHGTLDAVVGAAEGLDPTSWLRVRLDEAQRSGLADEVRSRLGELGPRVVDVAVVGSPTARAGQTGRVRRDGRTPRELFAEFLASRDVADPRLLPLFDELHEAVAGAEVEGVGG